MVIISKVGQDSSTSSTDLDTSFDERRVLELGKQLLKGRMFMGTLLEKYHVEKIDAYRDVISIMENERQFIRALRDFTQHIAKYYPRENWWIGITHPGTVGLPKTYCLWVDIPSGNPLGKYWFKIRNVKFQRNEMIVSVKLERRIEDEALKNDNTASSSELNGDKDINYLLDSLKENLEKGMQNLGGSLWYVFITITTPRNIKDTLVFLCLLTVACVTGLFELLKFFCEFLIKFLYAWSHFVNASIPILQVMLNFFENIFKVFCTFVAYMLKPRQQPVYQLHVPSKYANADHRRSLDYYPKQGVVITELN